MILSCYESVDRNTAAGDLQSDGNFEAALW